MNTFGNRSIKIHTYKLLVNLNFFHIYGESDVAKMIVLTVPAVPVPPAVPSVLKWSECACCSECCQTSLEAWPRPL